MEARSRVEDYFLIEILFYSHLNVSDWVAWFCTLVWVASGYGPLCAKRRSVAALLVYAYHADSQGVLHTQTRREYTHTDSQRVQPLILVIIQEGSQEN